MYLMTNKYKYFVGNWKMFGDLSSIKHLIKVNSYLKKNKKYKVKVIFCVPYTLINLFSKKLKRSKLLIGAQNCHFSNKFGAFTGSINPKMVENSGAKYIIIGHSENRLQGDTDDIINKKIQSSLKMKLKVIFCIGETLREKKRGFTNRVLNSQITKGMKDIKKLNNIIIAYEPVWSIGTGIIPNDLELKKNIAFIRHKLKIKYKKIKKFRILYGGSVNTNNIEKLNKISNLSGFLIGGASQSSKKFIDIINKSYI